MTKLYAKEATAQAIATKLSSKGTEHQVVEMDGQWAVVPVGQEPQVEEQLPAIVTGEDGEPVHNPELVGDQEETQVETTDAPKKKRHKAFQGHEPLSTVMETLVPADADASTVSVVFEGGFANKGFVNVPAVGGLPRWFKTESLTGYQQFSDGVIVTLSRKDLQKRKIDDLVQMYQAIA